MRKIDVLLSLHILYKTHKGYVVRESPSLLVLPLSEAYPKATSTLALVPSR